MAKYLNLEGEKFEDLTVIKKIENRNGRTYWKCLCKCGNETEVSTQQLRSGKTKSCGCLRKKSKNIKNLTGQKFGRLSVLYPTDKRDYRGSVYWHCQCECGEVKDITATDLLSGRIKSCGCLKKENNANIHKKLHMVDNTCVEFIEKRKKRKDNKSGFRGVYKVKDKYRVKIGFKGKRYYIGTFETFESAVIARLDAEKQLYNTFLKEYHEKETVENFSIHDENDCLVFNEVY